MRKLFLPFFYVSDYNSGFIFNPGKWSELSTLSTYFYLYSKVVQIIKPQTQQRIFHEIVLFHFLYGGQNSTKKSQRDYIKHSETHL